MACLNAATVIVLSVLLRNIDVWSSIEAWSYLDTKHKESLCSTALGSLDEPEYGDKGLLPLRYACSIPGSSGCTNNLPLLSNKRPCPMTPCSIAFDTLKPKPPRLTEFGKPG